MLSNLEQKKVLDCIAAAEAATSGELRVHLEANCKTDAVARAIDVFDQLEMQATAGRNGVLIYVAFADRKLAIIGDEGINTRVQHNFWDSTRDLMLAHFKEGRLAEGLCAGITEAGSQLARFFPPQENDQNELPNQISFGWQNALFFYSFLFTIAALFSVNTPNLGLQNTFFITFQKFRY